MCHAILIKNARVVDPSMNCDEVRPIAVLDGRIVEESEARNPLVLDMAGKIIAPGFIDVHVHLREPGQTHKEDTASATAAAAAGGFTTILAMPNTTPALDTPEKIKRITEVYRKNGHVNVLQAGAVSMGRDGVEQTDIPGLVGAGCPAVTDDGATPQNQELMKKIMMAAAGCHVPVIDHCENTSLSKPGVMHKGRISELLGLPGQPREAEISIVRRDLELAQQTGCHVHLQHISAEESLQLLAEARRNAVCATAELTPHHLLLTDRECIAYGTNAKMAPPLREESDREALVEALRSGLVGIVATDHAPHTADEKARGWLKAPFGITGIETVVPLLMTHLVHTGILSLVQFVSLFTKGPAELLGIDRGTLAVGAPADMTMIDPVAEYTISSDMLHSKSVNCPWIGWKVKGKIAGIFRSPLDVHRLLHEN